MENFNSEYDVKEKSMYLLHLDTTRIVILSSVLIGIIAVSFLIGMNINSKSGDVFSASDTQKSEILDEFNSSSNEDIEKLLNSTDDEKSDLDESMADLDGTSLLPENTEAVIPPKTTTKSPEPVVVKEKPKPVKKSTPVKNTVKETSKKTVKAVSYTPSKPKTVSTPSTATTEGFTVQIAAFDSISKAQNESTSINKLNYNSFIDKAVVNGKTFYRVKIGPLATKKEAIDILNNIQSNSKYSDSYIVTEK